MADALMPPVSTEGADASKIPSPPPPVATEKPRGPGRPKGSKTTTTPPGKIPATVQPVTPAKKVPTPEEVAAFSAAIGYTFRMLSGIMVQWRGDMYALKEIDPLTLEEPKRRPDGTTPEAINQADLLGKLWGVAMAPWLLDEGAPWLAALGATGMIAGPMVAADFARPKDQRHPPLKLVPDSPATQ